MHKHRGLTRDCLGRYSVIKIAFQKIRLGFKKCGKDKGRDSIVSIVVVLEGRGCCLGGWPLLRTKEEMRTMELQPHGLGFRQQTKGSFKVDSSHKEHSLTIPCFQP